MTYSIDFRKKVLSVREQEGLSIEETADRFSVGSASIARWIKEIKPKRTRIKVRTKLPLDVLQADREKHPDSYNYERAKRLGVGETTVWQALRALKLTYKKNFKTSRCRS